MFVNHFILLACAFTPLCLKQLFQDVGGGLSWQVFHTWKISFTYSIMLQEEKNCWHEATHETTISKLNSHIRYP